MNQTEGISGQETSESLEKKSADLNGTIGSDEMEWDLGSLWLVEWERNCMGLNDLAPTRSNKFCRGMTSQVSGLAK